MCVIIINEPNFTLSYDKLQNATYNNPHGFGLVLRDPKNKKIEVIKRCHKDGNDPKEIYELLKDNEDLERYLHLRWKTEGDISLDNTHPFPVFSSNRDEIYFMHNGTLHEFKPKVGHQTYRNGSYIYTPGDEDQSVSDSKKFNDEVLTPLLAKVNGENGVADIKDEFIMKIIHKFWGLSDNKGLLISSQQGISFIAKDKWKEINDGGHKFMASNDTYFDKLTRGPHYEKLKKQQEEAEKQAQKRFFDDQAKNENWDLTPLKDVNIKKQVSFTQSTIGSLLTEKEIYTPEGLALLENVTPAEFLSFIQDENDAVVLLMLLTKEYSALYKKYKGATEHIKKLVAKDRKVG